MTDTEDLPSYDTRDPKGWGGNPARGAALGRPCYTGEPEGTIHVRRSPLDPQGYDANGTYFGIGQALWWYADDGGNVDAVLRAADADEAVALVRERYPEADIQRGPCLPIGCFGAGSEPCPHGEDDKPADAIGPEGEDGDYHPYPELCENCYHAQYDIDNGISTHPWEDDDER